MERIRVRFKPMLGLFMILGGLFAAFAGLVTEHGITLIAGTVNIVAGVMFLIQPSFVVYRDRIEVRNPLGMTLKTYTFGSLAEIEIRGNKLYRRGEENPIRRGGWFVRETDLELVGEAIAAAQPAALRPSTRLVDLDLQR